MNCNVYCNSWTATVTAYWNSGERCTAGVVCDVTKYVGHTGEGPFIKHDLFIQRHTPFSTVQITPLKHGRVKSHTWDLLEASGQLHAPLALPPLHIQYMALEKRRISFSRLEWNQCFLFANLYSDCTITAEVRNTRGCSSTSPYVCVV
jgi:hypothetical protein